MTREVVIASRNRGKIAEILLILADLPFKFTSVADYPGVPEIEETGSSFSENARLKAVAVARATGKWALADDSGLEVDALGGRPGIYSARYSGPRSTDASNNELLLKELAAVPDPERTARYRAVMVLADEAGHVVAETDGSCEGLIGREHRGTGGFGYDPLFVVPEFSLTMAEIGVDVKNRISHRAVALERLRDRLKELRLTL